LENFGAEETFVWQEGSFWNGVEGPEKIRAFCRRIKNFGVVRRFDTFDFHAFHGNIQPTAAMRTSVEGASWNSAIICQNGWFIKGLAASVVGTFQLFTVSSNAKKRHA